MASVRARVDSPEMLSYAEARLSDDVLGVREEYLDAAWRTLLETYGSVTGFLKAAGVSDDDITALRGALVG